ncbi:MAG: hypothetical protein ABIW32_00840, partial [Terrimesophilobacter sp.]
MKIDTFGGKQNAPLRPRAIVLLAAVLFVEAAMLAVLAGFLLYELVVEKPTSMASALAILALAIAATAALVAVGVGVLRMRPWVRGAALTWQFLQIAVAVGSFQGLFARSDIGWLLLVPALLVIGLLFT